MGRALALACVSKEDAGRFWSKVDTSGGPDSCWPYRVAIPRPRGWTFGCSRCRHGGEGQAGCWRQARRIVGPGVSQCDAAWLLGVHHSLVSLIVRGKCRAVEAEP